MLLIDYSFLCGRDKRLVCGCGEGLFLVFKMAWVFRFPFRRRSARGRVLYIKPTNTLM